LRPHLDELLAGVEIVPAVNQIEFHPYLQSRPLLEFCRARQIQVEAWSPLMQGGSLLRDPAISEISRAHGKTLAQIILRWDVQSGIVTIPKSAKPERIAENAAVFDFELSATEMSTIDALEKNHRCGPDPMNFPF
jgi:diketogulonate reductase-like aldo/keto reductase